MRRLVSCQNAIQCDFWGESVAVRPFQRLKVTAAVILALLVIASGALAVSTDGGSAEGQVLSLGDVLAVGVAGSLIGPEPAAQTDQKLASNAR
jgi:hypothetical protein